MWKYLLIVVLFFATLTAQAQPGMKGERFNQIKEAREAFLKEKLSLTEEESETFFPVFWQYEARIRKVSKGFILNRQGKTESIGQLSEQDAEVLLMTNRKRKQEILSLGTEAEDAYLQILSARKVVMLQLAEKEFKEKLLRRLRQQRKGERHN